MIEPEAHHVGEAAGGDDPCDLGVGCPFDSFMTSIEMALGRDLTSSPVGSSDRSTIISDLQLDELEVCLVVAALQELNPHFFIPDGVDMGDVTLGDLHFYVESMTEGNHPT